MRKARLIQDYLCDILDAMEKAERFVTGIDFAAFQQDDKTMYAVIRCLEIIGEAAKKVPDSVRQRFPAVPWKSLAGMGDKLTN